MKNLVLTLAVAGAAVVGFASIADASGGDRTWRTGWKQSITRTAPTTSPTPLTEGRNASTRNGTAQGVEPYISQQIQRDRHNH